MTELNKEYNYDVVVIELGTSKNVFKINVNQLNSINN